MQDFKSIFDNMTEEEFDNMLIKNNIKFSKVNKGEGGILYKGKLYRNIEDLDKAFDEEN